MFIPVLLAAVSVPQCTQSTSVHTTVEEMAKSPDRWFDRCVQLDGYVSRYYFYTDTAGRYRHRATDKDDRRNEGWLGLYFRHQEETRKPFGKASVIGRVDDCERSHKAAQARAGPDAIIMPLGYCHYEGGLTLKDVTVGGRSEARFDRAHGEEARQAFGDLEHPGAKRPVPNPVVKLVEQFRTTFDAQDDVELSKLVMPWDIVLEDQPDRQRQYSDLISGKSGPLADFRTTGSLPNPVWFVTRLPKDADYEPDWYACFCRIGNCDGVWPISHMDTGFDPELPYACVLVAEDATAAHTLGLNVSVSAIIDDDAD